jgi:hypothetical protein
MRGEFGVLDGACDVHARGHVELVEHVRLIGVPPAELPHRQRWHPPYGPCSASAATTTEMSRPALRAGAGAALADASRARGAERGWDTERLSAVEPRVYQQLFDHETLAGYRRLSTDTIDRSGQASSAAFASVTTSASRSMTSTPSLSAIGPGAARPDDRRRRLASSRARTAECAEAGRCGSGAPELTGLIAGTDPGRTARDMSLSDPHNKITPVASWIEAGISRVCGACGS